MATYEQLFGPKANPNRPKRAPAAQWNTVGDVHTGVISGEPIKVPDFDFQSKRDKYMVKTDDPSRKSPWQVLTEGSFDKELEHFLIEQIAIPVKLVDGTDTTWYYRSKDQELMDAMAEDGLPIEEGITISRKFLRKDGQKKIMKTKLAK
jgi:hypothetical protein